MSLISLYSLFFAIAIGALAPTEAHVVPAGKNLPEVAVEDPSVHLGDQAHQEDDVVLIQREKQGQSVSKTLTKAAITIAVLALVVLFFRGAKQYYDKQRELKRIEKEIRRDDAWAKKPDQDIKKEANRRYNRMLQIIKQKDDEDEWEGPRTWAEKLEEAWEEEKDERKWAEINKRLDAEKKAEKAEKAE